jgi:hypothetical protein
MAQSRARSEFADIAGIGDDPAADGDGSAEMDIEEGEGQYVDFSDVDENASEYPVYPRGIYSAELVEMEYGKSQRSGNNMWTTIWEFDVPEDVATKAGQKDLNVRPRAWVHLTFTDAGQSRVKKALIAMKCEDDANLRLLKGRFDPQKVADESLLLGATARLRMDIRRYEGKNRNNVREILPPLAGSGTKSSFGNL